MIILKRTIIANLGHQWYEQLPGEETVAVGTNGGGGANGGDPGQGFPVTGPHRSMLFAKLQW